MTSQARIEANRRNAARSTGPRTAEGKDKVRLNALKHGLSATTVVLPHEDAQAYQQRLETWTAELAPRGDVGRYLVERAARISWQLDRADLHETARLAKPVRQDRIRLKRSGRVLRREGPGPVRFAATGHGRRPRGAPRGAGGFRRGLP